MAERRDGAIVETAHGRIQGSRSEDVFVFRGIPFAAPPVGNWRLRPPRPPEPWTGVRDATRPGPVAPQRRGLLSTLLGRPDRAMSEDCLNLNVFTPGADAARRPVMVWIHGGSFVTGAGSDPVYDGRRLTKRGDVVVITLNYRLGALGFLAVPGLADDETDGAGNFGLLDQLAALEWVRENAAAFGGDPEQVTVFGQSAGAMCLGALLGAPRAAGLFRRAILQSGAADNALDLEESRLVADAYLAELNLGGDPVAELRRLPLPAILDAQQRCALALRGRMRQLPFQPVVDGKLLPRPPLESIAAGAAAGVELLVGSNLDEYRFYGLNDRKLDGLDAAALQRRCDRNISGTDASGRRHSQRVIEAYGRARGGRASTEPADLWFAIETDRWFRVPATRLLERQARHATATYAYLFTWPSPALDGRLGACHALELPFVFGTVEHPMLRPFAGEGPAVRRLSDRMLDAWLGFARPAAAGLPGWPGYDGERRATMVLGERCRVEDAPMEAERAVWEGIF